MKHDPVRIDMSEDLGVRPSAAAFKPSRVLRVWGMRRSGNHAVINWLMRNAPTERAVFFNNCHPSENPLHNHASVELFRDGRQTKRGAGKSASDLLSTVGKGAVMIASYEDKMPPAPDAQDAVLAVDGQDVIVYRSFLNWSASLLKKLQRNPARGPTWRMMVLTKACQTYCTALDRAQAAPHAILFDRWVADPAYRLALLDQLDFARRDNSLGAAQRYGGGSSFQPDACDGTVLRTDTRAEEMARAPEYLRFLSLVQSDAAMMDKIAYHFPQDAEHISLRLIQGVPQ